MNSEIKISQGTADRIVSALADELRAKPYKKISVSELAAAAGISRQAFYLYFSDRDEVLNSMFHKLFSDIMQSVAAMHAETVESLVGVYTDVVEEHAEFLKILADNDLGPFLSREFVKELVEIKPVLNIQKEPANDAEQLYINCFWVSAFTNVYSVWLKGGMKTRKDELNAILTDIMTGVYFSK